MTGPEHYREAERLLSEAAAYDETADTTTVDLLKLTAAQVHATLALAAAQAPVVNTMQEQEILGRRWNQAVSA